MDILSFVSAAAASIHAILDRPRISTLSKEGWKIDHKQVNTYKEREISSDTDFFTDKELRTRDYYSLYGITIQNKGRRLIGSAEVAVRRAAIRVWNSKGQQVADRYLLRLWEDRNHPEVYPLFPKNKTDVGKEIVLGQGGALDLPIAYNQENEPYYYRFTMSTSANDAFPSPRDQFVDAMPHYAIVEVQGSRINKHLFLSIEEAKPTELKVSVISEDEFPFEVRE